MPPSRLKLVFNMVEDGVDVEQSFESLLADVAEHPVAQANPACRLGANEVYERVKGTGDAMAALARDETDYKALTRWT